jgi:hypothetical protein
MTNAFEAMARVFRDGGDLLDMLEAEAKHNAQISPGLRSNWARHIRVAQSLKKCSAGATGRETGAQE